MCIYIYIYLKASPLPPTLMLPSWSHLELQVSWWSFGAQGCHLKLQVAIWMSRVQFGAPGNRLEVQVAVWSSKWPCGAPDGHVELQMAAWGSDWQPPGPGGLPACGSLWQPVASCGNGIGSPQGQGVCRPVATCGLLWQRHPAPVETFTLRI